MRGGIRLGRVLGVPVTADPSAFVLALLFAAAVFVDLRRLPDATTTEAGLLSLAAGIGVVACVYVHEITHVAVAVMKHASVRSVRLYMYGGYSVIDGMPSPTVEALIAIAGPAASLMVAAVLWVLSMALDSGSVLGRALFALALANAAIGVFNLLPGLPLDGGRVLRGLLTAGGSDRVKATRTATVIGRVTGYLAIVVGVYLLVTRSPTGLFWIAGGWFLAASAAATGRREELSTTFDGQTIRDVMRPTPEAVSGNWTVSIMLDMYPLGPTLRSLPVEMDGRVVGTIGREEIDTVSPSRWPSVRLRSLMTKIGPGDIVAPDDPLEILFIRNAGPSGRRVVVETGRVIGLVDAAHLESISGADSAA